MSVFGAMFSSVSGLDAQGQALAMIADNISNMNTIGYKAVQARFQTLVVNQALESSYAPGGVSSSPFYQVERQGLLQNSSSATDLAISGNGFFIGTLNRTPGANDQRFFTRAGQFAVDENGALRNNAGLYLQGWVTDTVGNPTGVNNNLLTDLTTVNISSLAGSASATTSVTVGANVPAEAAVNESHVMNLLVFDSLGVDHNMQMTWTKDATPNEWSVSATAIPNTSVVTLLNSTGQVYASSGRLDFSRLPTQSTGGAVLGDTVTIAGTTFEFTDGAGAVGGGNVEVDISASVTIPQVLGVLKTAVDASAVPEPARITVGTGADINSLFLTQSATGAAIAVADGPVLATAPFVAQVDPFTVAATAATGAGAVFNGDGTPNSFNLATASVDWANGAINSTIALNLGTAGPLGTGQTDGVTQFSSNFFVSFVNQNGVSFGSFTGVNINEEGIVTAQFDNGDSRAIYRIPIATFANPNGLDPKNGNAFSQTDDSGNFFLNNANTGIAGKVAASALEASTVDLAEEFTNMIIAQRAYSANAKIITTADEMLDELIRVKR